MAIPEFILRKMLVPGSYHYDRSRFQFILKNDYAQGTITSLRVIADGVEVPAGQVEYTVEGQPPAIASGISLSNSALMPTGVQVKIAGKVASRPKRLVLWVETREAGAIHFAVFNDSKLKRDGSRWMNALRKPLHARLVIDLDETFDMIDNLSHDSRSPGFNPEDQHTSRLRLPLLKWPVAGLHFASTGQVDLTSFDFFEADLFESSMLSNAPSRVSLEHTANQHQVYGLLDATSASITRLAGWLSAHSPFSPSKWLIWGNAWQPWEISTESAHAYGRKVSRLASVLHNFDPAAQVGMLCKFVDSTNPEDFGAQWNDSAFRGVNRDIDFAYWQLPPFEVLSEDAETSQATIIESCIAHVRKMARSAREIQSQLAASIPGRQIRQAIDISCFFFVHSPVRFNAKWLL